MKSLCFLNGSITSCKFIEKISNLKDSVILRLMLIRLSNKRVMFFCLEIPIGMFNRES